MEHLVLVKRFYIVDIENTDDPEVQKMNNLLAENPSYTKAAWQQSGPCSNWGYDVLRPMTDSETQDIKNEFKDAIKRTREAGKKHV